jgi:hypothetical protein
MGGIVAEEAFDIQCFMASWFPGFLVGLRQGSRGLAWGNHETVKPGKSTPA